MAIDQLPVEHLFSLTAEVGDTSQGIIRNGPGGTRVIAPVVGGTFTGPKLAGTILPPAGDWVTMRGKGVMKLDVRLVLRTDDGETILMTYQGIGTPDEDGSHRVRTAPTFETGAEAYAWLNAVQAVGIGVSANGTVSYEVYALR